MHTERFEMRLTPEDRQRLDQLAAQVNKSRAEVFKSWLRNAEPGGGPSDKWETAEVSEANAVSLSEQL